MIPLLNLTKWIQRSPNETTINSNTLFEFYRMLVWILKIPSNHVLKKVCRQLDNI